MSRDSQKNSRKFREKSVNVGDLLEFLAVGRDRMILEDLGLWEFLGLKKKPVDLRQNPQIAWPKSMQKKKLP